MTSARSSALAIARDSQQAADFWRWLVLPTSLFQK
jgi:hypothetical protein